MRRVDEIHLERPYYGSRRMSEVLRREGLVANRKRIQRLMAEMGIEAIYPKRNLSKACQESLVFPYLLRGLPIVRANQVWSADITYIRMRQGFLYLVAVIDWFSRYVLSWELSNTLEVDFCIAALQAALKSGKPEIFNTDQGAQFSTPRFSGLVLENGIRMSMDGRGRAIDNVFVERLWRSLKYEEVYLKDYVDGLDARSQLAAYLSFYNEQRPHQALQYRTPAEVHFAC